MNPEALAKSAFLALILLLSSQTAMPQQTPESGEIASFLRIAGAQLPNIDKNQQSSMASNIAGAQTRIGDLAGALSTVQAVESEEGRVFATGFVASGVAWQGNVQLAIDLIQKSAAGNDHTKADAYLFVAQQLAGKHAFEESLKVARLIADGPGFFGKTNRLVETLMGIQTKQWEARDWAGAEATLKLALDAVERETADPYTQEFADTMPAGLYGEITNTLSREGNRTEASGVVERIYAMVAAARTPEIKQELLYYLAIAQINLGEVQTALNTAEQLMPGQWRDGALLVIAMERTRQGNPLDALDEAVAVSSDSWRNTSLRGIADALAGSGNYTVALSTIDRIQGEGERAYGLSELALEQAEKSDPSATLTVELAWEAALKVASETKPYVFGQIAVTRAMLGDFAGAIEISANLNHDENAWVLQNLTAMMVDAGEEIEAIALAEKQDVPYLKASAFLGIGRQLIEQQQAAKRKAENARTN